MIIKTYALTTFITTICFFLVALWYVEWYAKLPTVYKSWSEGVCLSVEDYTGKKHDCGYEKDGPYHLVRVK